MTLLCLKVIGSLSINGDGDSSSGLILVLLSAAQMLDGEQTTTIQHTNCNADDQYVGLKTYLGPRVQRLFFILMKNEK